MSGGSFGYLCRAFICFETPENLLEMVEYLDEGSPERAATEEIVKCFKKIYELGNEENLTGVWQAIEWNRSGDWGEERVREAVSKYRDFHAKKAIADKDEETARRRLIRQTRKFELKRTYAKTVSGNPVHAQRIAADADRHLLEDLEKLMSDPNSGLTPERRRHVAELLEAVRWWAQNHSGEYFETKPGQSSCDYILERYKRSIGTDDE